MQRSGDAQSLSFPPETTSRSRGTSMLRTYLSAVESLQRLVRFALGMAPSPSPEAAERTGAGCHKATIER